MRINDILTEMRDVPGTNWGYWITDAGEIIPVGYQAHGKALNERFPEYKYHQWIDYKTYNQSILYDYVHLKGWIRVLIREQTGIDISVKYATKEAILSLIDVLNSGAVDGVGSYVVSFMEPANPDFEVPKFVVKKFITVKSPKAAIHGILQKRRNG